MSLPNLPAGDKFRREVRTEWGGLNLNESAGDGELIEALNMSSREFPLLATRREWYRRPINGTMQPQIADSAALGASKRVFWVSKDSGVWKFFYSFAAKGTLSAATRAEAAKIRFAMMQDKIFIFPDKKVYNETADTMSEMEASFVTNVGGGMVFMDGTYGGVAAEGNTIYRSGADWGSLFRVGDAVTISGCKHEENNKSAIIREIDGDYLRFYENTFTNESTGGVFLDLPDGLAAGSYHFTWNGTTSSFTITGAIPAGIRLELTSSGLFYMSVNPPMPVTIGLVTADPPLGEELVFSTASVKRTVPDMDFVCVNENRMWGCKGDTIYASKLGDPLNWNVFDGLSTDSWTAETGTPRDFTGCCSYMGYPTFFKAGSVFRVMGDYPDQFSVRKLDIPGVSEGSDLSVAVVESTLYYLSDKGVCAWNGSADPTIISRALGIDRRWYSGRAGTDGRRYYLSAFEMAEKPEDYPTAKWMYTDRDLCYDTRFGAWYELSLSELSLAFDTNRPTGYSRYARQEDKLYFLDSETNSLLMLEGVPDAYSVGVSTWNAESPSADSHNWRVTFADSTRAYKTALTGSESKKGVLRLLIRCRISDAMKVWIAYDGGDFEEAAEFTAMDKNSKVVPLILRRCDFWQLRLTGTGDAVIYSIAVEKYGGEWQQA